MYFVNIFVVVIIAATY